MKLVKIAYGNDDDQKSFQETQGLLQAYPNLKGIISPDDGRHRRGGALPELEQVQGQGALTGLGTPNQMRKFVKDGTVQGFELWDPGELGYLAGYAAAALASGKITGKGGESFEAGPLGTKQIGAQRRGAARPADGVQQGQHRQVQLLASLSVAALMERVCFELPGPP